MISLCLYKVINSSSFWEINGRSQCRRSLLRREVRGNAESGARYLGPERGAVRYHAVDVRRLHVEEVVVPVLVPEVVADEVLHGVRRRTTVSSTSLETRTFSSLFKSPRPAAHKACDSSGYRLYTSSQTEDESSSRVRVACAM